MQARFAVVSTAIYNKIGLPTSGDYPRLRPSIRYMVSSSHSRIERISDRWFSIQTCHYYSLCSIHHVEVRVNSIDTRYLQEKFGGP